MNIKPLLKKHASTFLYDSREIPFYFWSHTTSGTDSIDTVIFLGSGQSGVIAKWVAGNAPSGTVVVEGLPHKQADRSGVDLKEYARDYTETAYLAVLKEFNIHSANIVAESQAAPGAMWAALDLFDSVKSMVLIAPLGLTAHVLGNSPKQRLKTLKWRAFLSAMQRAQSPFYDPRNFYLSSVMLHALLSDTRWNVSGQKYAVGASHDLRRECRDLATQLHQRGDQLMLILGDRDKIFPSDEIMASVEAAEIKYVNTVTLRTSHASLAIRDGKEILSRALQALRR
jgi:pimeloyl-ACP methyl ester carboxylesterase